MQVTAYDLAERFIGLSEVPGVVSNPQILVMLQLDNSWPENDEVPWCSAYTSYIAWLLRLPRSRSLRARSWLEVGHGVDIRWSTRGFDIVVLKRSLEDPGPEVLDYIGHVGFFSSLGDDIKVLGGNQHNSVNVSSYDLNLVLGIRRLYVE